MTDTRSLNAFLAWLLAFALAGLPAFALSWLLVRYATQAFRLGEMAMWGDDSLFVVWGSLGLALTALAIRPAENLVRRFGYGLPAVEEAQGRQDGQDRVSDTAEAALAERLKAELDRD